MGTDTSSGIGFIAIMQILLVVMKLINFVKWSWWITLLPLEISAAMVIIGMIVYFIVMRNQ